MENKTTYVLDTTVLIEDPEVFYKLSDSNIVLPKIVLRELDGLKNSDREAVAKSARAVSRILDKVSSYGNLSKGLILSGKGSLTIISDYEDIDDLSSRADNIIVGTALKVKSKHANVILLTTDTNMRIVARYYDLSSDIPDLVNVKDIDRSSFISISKVPLYWRVKRLMSSPLFIIFFFIVGIGSLYLFFNTGNYYYLLATVITVASVFIIFELFINTTKDFIHEDFDDNNITRQFISPYEEFMYKNDKYFYNND